MGWDTQVGKLVNKSSEVAEEMVPQYKSKNEEVKEAIGQPVIDYLARLQRLTAGNCGRFDLLEVTEKEVREAIQKVDDKQLWMSQEAYNVSRPLREAIKKASFFWTLSKRGGGGVNRNPKVLR